VGRRSVPSDRVFKVVALVAGLCLSGFIIFVAVRGPAKADPTLGVAALEGPPPAVLGVGVTAPSFTLPRLGGGAPVSLVSYRGRPVVISFFASWCPHCRAELSAMGSMATRDAGRVAVLGVDSNDSSGAAAERLLASAHATYPVGVDTDAQVATKYLLSVLPVTYFVNASGQIMGSAYGSQSVASLTRWVDRLTAHTP
jgi:peroxiredoxin